MSKLLKILGIIIAVVVVLMAIVFFWLDPNVFKPKIQAIAKEQGVNLTIKGDMRWQFWPSVGFEINDISVASMHAPNDTLATLAQASLLVATGPLLSGKIEVHHLTAEGAYVNLVTDAAGVSNWTPLLQVTKNTAEQKSAKPQEPESPASQMPATETADLQLFISAISVSNAVVSMVDETVQQKTLITLDKLQIKNVNTTGQPINIDAAWAIGREDAAAQAFNLSGKADAVLNLQENLSALSAAVELDMALSGKASKENFSGKLNLQAKDLKTTPSFQGQWTMAPVNIKNLLASLGQAAPVTKNPEALTKVSMNIDFNGTESAMSLAPLAVTMDQTKLTGSVEITDIKNATTVIKLKGDRINVDDYLPPAVEAKAGSDSTTNASSKVDVAATPAEPLIPLAVIKGLDVTATLDWQEMIAANLKFKNLKLYVTAKNGVVNLHNASLDAYEGKVAITGKLQARANTANLNFNADMQGVELAPLLKDLSLDEDAQLSGAINLNAVGNTSGVTAQALMDALVAEAKFDGAKVKFSPLNVEERFCQLVTLLNEDDEVVAQTDAEAGTEPVNNAEPQTKAKIEWPKYTAMRELNGLARMKNQIITLESFNAGVAHLGLTTLGTVDLKQEKYELYLPFTLFEKNTSELGCTVKSNYWLNRSLSLLKCHGSLASLSPVSDCGFDKKALGSLTKDYAAYKVKKELTKKFADDNEDGEKSLESQAVDVLFDIFTQKNKGKNEQ